jgi:hypothetical protein
MVAEVTEACPLRSCPSGAIIMRAARCLAQGSNVVKLARIWKSESGNDFICIAVDASHFLYLILSFAMVELVDTECINPAE